MIVTGFEILGVISGGAGLLSLVASTVRNLNTTWTDAKQCKHHLELKQQKLVRYGRSLDSCRVVNEQTNEHSLTWWG